MSTSLFPLTSDIVNEGLNERGMGDETAPPSIDDKDIQKLEKVLKDYNANSKKVFEDAQKIHEINSANNSDNVPRDFSDEELSDAEINELYELSKQQAQAIDQKTRSIPGYKNAAVPKDLELRKLSENVSFMLAPIAKLSHKEIENLLREKNQGTWVQSVFDKEPRLYSFAVSLLKDKEALPKLVSMSESKDKIMVLFWWMIGTFVFSIILKKIIMNPTMPFFTALFWGLFRFVLINSVRMYIFWYIYEDELTPTVKIVKKVFFS